MAAIGTAAPLARAETAGLRYRALGRRRAGLIALLALLLILSVILDMAIGPASYALSDVASAVLFPSSATDQVRVVVWDIRMPVALMAVVVGAAL